MAPVSRFRKNQCKTGASGKSYAAWSDDVANFRRRLLNGEWLAQQVHASIRHSIVDYRVARAAGHEKHLEVRVPALRLVRSRKHRHRERLGRVYPTLAKPCCRRADLAAGLLWLRDRPSLSAEGRRSEKRVSVRFSALDQRGRRLAFSRSFRDRLQKAYPQQRAGAPLS